MSYETQLLDVVIHEGRGVISPNEELAIRLWIRSAVSAIAKADELQAQLQYKNNMIDNLNGIIERIEKKSAAMQDLIETNEMQEYETKAKAYENIKADITEDLRSMREKKGSFPFVYEAEIETLNNILAAMAQYESGESE